MDLNHFGENGKAVMVDVTGKDDTFRTAVAEGYIKVNEKVYNAIERGTAAKGDVLGTATVAGIMAAKKTWEIIPMCHLIPIGSCAIDFKLNDEEKTVTCRCTVKTVGKTGAEMEALNGVSAALLTIYDMCKALDKTMVISGIRMLEKTGGRSGTVINRR